MEMHEQKNLQALEKRLAAISRSESRSVAAAVLHDFTLPIRGIEGGAAGCGGWPEIVAANEAAHRAAGYLLPDVGDASYLAAVLLDATAAGIVDLGNLDERGLLGRRDIEVSASAAE